MKNDIEKIDDIVEEISEYRFYIGLLTNELKRLNSNLDETDDPSQFFVLSKKEEAYEMELNSSVDAYHLLLKENGLDSDEELALDH